MAKQILDGGGGVNTKPPLKAVPTNLFPTSSYPAVPKPRTVTGEVLPPAMTPAQAAQFNAQNLDFSGFGPIGGGDGSGDLHDSSIDWSSYLSDLGIPKNILDEITRQFGSDQDTSRAIGNALAYLRGTPWYAQTFPGINEGVAKGLLSRTSPEQDYRQHLNQVDQLYRQYYGRQISTLEYSAFLREGVDASTIANRIQGQELQSAYSKTTPEGLFTPEELQAAAYTKAGLATQNGEYLSGLLGYAPAVNNLYQQYQGRGVNRAELESLYRANTSPVTLSKQFAGQNYANVNAPEIQQTAGAFGEGQLTPSDLTAFGQEQTGLYTPLGAKLTRALSLANQRMTRAFQGVVAGPALNGIGQGLSRGQKLDAGA